MYHVLPPALSLSLGMATWKSGQAENVLSAIASGTTRHWRCGVALKATLELRFDTTTTLGLIVWETYQLLPVRSAKCSEVLSLTVINGRSIDKEVHRNLYGNDTVRGVSRKGITKGWRHGRRMLRSHFFYSNVRCADRTLSVGTVLPVAPGSLQLFRLSLIFWATPPPNTRVKAEITTTVVNGRLTSRLIAAIPPNGGGRVGAAA